MEENGYCRITHEAPTKGLLGYCGEFVSDIRGEDTLVRRTKGYTPYKGETIQRTNGTMIFTETGGVITHAPRNLQECGSLFIPPQTEVYEGMVIDESTRSINMDTNLSKNRKLTVVRFSGNDEVMRLTPPEGMTLGGALEWINDDELVETTSDSIRPRRKGLEPYGRRQHYCEGISDEVK